MIAPFLQEARRDISVLGQILDFQFAQTTTNDGGLAFVTRSEGKDPGPSNRHGVKTSSNKVMTSKASPLVFKSANSPIKALRTGGTTSVVLEYLDR
ncbi:hypothetical protein H0H81_009375, partial [Sphagnurus paluster]